MLMQTEGIVQSARGDESKYYGIGQDRHGLGALSVLDRGAARHTRERVYDLLVPLLLGGFAPIRRCGRRLCKPG